MPIELISIYHRLQNCFSPAKKRCSSNNIIFISVDCTELLARLCLLIYHIIRCPHRLRRPQGGSDGGTVKQVTNHPKSRQIRAR
ncbi:hypothetical protein CJZ35_25400 [Salmonella enterica subsp. enterica serovar Braenderup]|nr:hypothetical protein CJZ35_25400 [Salmonella enterica subsp. enterica serovar Braenderup]